MVIIMDSKLFIQAITKFFLGFIIVALLIFVSAGTINYWQGWLFICLLFIPMFIAGIILMIKNPDLLRIRLNAKEKEKEQKDVVLLSGIMFIVGFIIAGLNYRYQWLILPNIVVYIASIVFLISYVLYAVVLKENIFLSRTIEVQNNQKLVDTGLYGIVRHPMYTATIFLFISMPLILGSIYSFIIFLIYPFLMIKRINNEEMVLEKELIGYKEYKNKVKYKLIPFIY